MTINYRFLPALLVSACLALPLWAQQVAPPPGIDLPVGARILTKAPRLRQAPVAPRRQATLDTKSTEPKGPSLCNIVDNPTFDSQLTRPTGTLSNVPGSSITQQNALAVWRCTEFGSADHYATNANPGTDAHPNSSLYGSFTPHNNGPSAVNGCAGICTHSDYIDSNNNYQVYREYITQKMLQPMQEGKAYYVSFWAMLAPRAQYATTLTLNFTNTDPSAPLGVTQTYTPSQYSITTPVLTQYSWTHVTELIYLQPDEVGPVPDLQYLNIGGMDASYQLVDPLVGYPSSYYYIDDVEIYEMPVAPVPRQAYTCTGKRSVDIGYGCDAIPGATYTWTTTNFDGTPATTGLPPNPNDLFNQVNPIAPRKYTLTVGLPTGSSWTSSVSVYPRDWLGITARPSDSYNEMPSGSTLCNGRFMLLSPENHVATGPFTWKVDGQTMPSGWFVTHTGPDYTFTTGQYNEVRLTPRTTSTRIYNITCEGTGACLGSPVSASYSFTYDPGCRLAAAKTLPSADMFSLTPQGEGNTLAYPNPVADYLTLPAGAQQVELRDAMGQPLLQQAVSGQKLDVHDLPEGIYQLRLMQDGTSQTQRIVIKH